MDNFDMVRHEKSRERFDIWFGEKKPQTEEDAINPTIVSNGFMPYKSIQDYPLRGRATYLHLRKRRWLDKQTSAFFSYEIGASEYPGTRLNAEFVSFLKDGG